MCNKAYSDNLINLNLLHSGERPYICDVYNKAYSDKGNLITHKRTVVSDIMFVMCDKVIKWQEYEKT